MRDTKETDKFESLVTGDDGKFAFNAIPAGKYSLAGTKRGYITAAYDQHDQFSTAIVTGADLDTENRGLTSGSRSRDQRENSG